MKLSAIGLSVGGFFLALAVGCGGDDNGGGGGTAGSGTGGASTGGAGTGGAGTGGASTGGSNDGTGGTTSGGNACAQFCAKIAEIACEGDESEADCVVGCESDREICTEELDAFAICWAAQPTSDFACDEDDESELTTSACDAEAVAALACAFGD